MSRLFLPSLVAIRPRIVGGCKRAGVARRAVLRPGPGVRRAALRNRFTCRTGLTITPKYDTEAKKTVGLLTELIGEQQRPRCDVFWNNEPVGTVRLRKLGLLQPYDSPAAAPFPASAKAPDHTWYAFAQRARILLVNTKLVPENDRPRSLLDLTDPRWRGRVAMAVPLYGTTATQAACLFDVLGPEKAKEFYRGLKANGVQLAPGNKQVAEWVGAGQSPTGGAVAVGVSDTDDAMAEVEKGRPVTILFPDQETPKDGRLGTLFLPNTLGIIKGCPNPEGARKLIDFLLSPEIETALAEGESHQLPLNPGSEGERAAAGRLAPAKDAKPMQRRLGQGGGALGGGGEVPRRRIRGAVIVNDSGRGGECVVRLPQRDSALVYFTSLAESWITDSECVHQHAVLVYGWRLVVPRKTFEHLESTVRTCFSTSPSGPGGTGGRLAGR